MITSHLDLSSGSALTIPGMEISDLCVAFMKFTSLGSEDINDPRGFEK